MILYHKIRGVDNMPDPFDRAETLRASRIRYRKKQFSLDAAEQ